MQYKKNSNKIKLIGGKYKNKIINFNYTNTSLRPTSNRARETLFNWLMYDIQDSNCLDLFAGSGALSFEALSRGAGHITLIEQSKEIYNNLIKIKSDFSKETDKINLINQSSLDFINNNSKNIYNIIFIDPPFDLIDNKFLSIIFNNLTNHNYVDPNTIIYLESNIVLDKIITENSLNIIKHKKISSVYIYLCNIK